jgi:hypothetical protein
MRILVFMSFCFAIAFMLGLDVVLWIENPLYGIGGIVGIVAYFIAYSISGDMIIAPRDFWRLSNWQVFKKKMGYAFSAYLLVTLVAAGVLGAVFS